MPVSVIHSSAKSAIQTEMTARHLLETDGATWRFRHRLMQAYFAEQWKDEPGTLKKNL